MVQLIADKTNTKIQHVKDNLSGCYKTSGKNTFIHSHDQCKLCAFIGFLLYTSGLLAQPMHT